MISDRDQQLRKCKLLGKPTENVRNKEILWWFVD